jgi:hypothetical protein
MNWQEWEAEWVRLSTDRLHLIETLVYKRVWISIYNCWHKMYIFSNSCGLVKVYWMWIYTVHHFQFWCIRIIQKFTNHRLDQGWWSQLHIKASNSCLWDTCHPMYVLYCSLRSNHHVPCVVFCLFRTAHTQISQHSFVVVTHSFPSLSIICWKQ